MVNGTAYFATRINFRRALWKTDGTEAGPVMLKDSIITTAESGRFLIKGHVGDTLYYTVNTLGQSDYYRNITTGYARTTDNSNQQHAGRLSSGESRQYAFCR